MPTATAPTGVYLPRHPERLGRIARYDTRAPIALEMIRRLCTQIPDARQHMTLYYGWYSRRARGN